MIALLSTSDTDLLSARASGAGYRLGNPARLSAERRSRLHRRRGRRRRAHPRRAPGLGRRARRRAGLRRARRRARRRAGAGRRAHGAVDGVDRDRRRGARVPGARRPGEPAAARPVPVGRGHADRRGVRTPRADARLGTARSVGGPGARGRARAPAGGRHLVLPRPSRRGEHRLRARARRRGGGGGRAAAPGVLLVAADRRARADRHAARGGRDRRDRPRRRRPRPGDGRRRRLRRGMGRRRARQPGRADPAGPVPDLLPRPVGRQRRGADPAGRRHPGRDPRVRRPPHHRPVLLQGDRPRRPDQLRPRPGAHRAGRGHRREARGPAARPGGRAARRAHAVGVPDQARPHRQRGRPRHPGLGRRAARRDAGRRLRHRRRGSPRRRRRGRRRAHPRDHRRRRTGRGLAHPGAARGQPGPDPRGGLPGVVRHPRPGPAERRHRALGRAARRAVHRPQPGPGRARSCWPRCARATSW